MGTDIHVAVEVRRNGAWRYHTPKTLCRWYHEVYTDQVTVDRVNERKLSKGWPVVKVGDRSNPWDKCKYRLPDAFDSRNYLKFAILGNVRNGYGFAGVKTFDPLPAMSDNRGFPDGMTSRAMAQMSREHSESWLTLAEMMDYDFSIELVEEGVVDEVTYLTCLIKDENPKTWSGETTGPGIETLSPEQYLALYGSPRDIFNRDPVVPRTYDTTKRYFIRHRWTLPLATAPHQIDEIITYLHDQIPRGGSAEDVRMIFDFDS